MVTESVGQRARDHTQPEEEEQEEEVESEGDEMDLAEFVGFLAEQSEEEQWSFSHTHVYVRCGDDKRPYCCICRRRRAEEIERLASTVEEAFTRRWPRRKERKLKALAADFEKQVETTRKAAATAYSQDHQVHLAVIHLVDTVVARDERQRVLRGVAVALVNVSSAKESSSAVVRYHRAVEIELRHNFHGDLPEAARCACDLDDKKVSRTTRLPATSIEVAVATKEDTIGKVRIPWRLLLEAPRTPMEIPLLREDGSFVGSTVTIVARLADAGASIRVLRASHLPPGTSAFAVVLQDGDEAGRTHVVCSRHDDDSVVWGSWQPSSQKLTDKEKAETSSSSEEDSDDDDEKDNVDYVRLTIEQQHRRYRRNQKLKDGLGLLRSAASDVSTITQFQRKVGDLMYDREVDVEKLRAERDHLLECEEEERRKMASEERRSRREEEALRRQCEEGAKVAQERGQRLFQRVIDDVAHRGGSVSGLTRLRWMETLQVENTFAAFQCLDPARRQHHSLVGESKDRPAEERVLVSLLFLVHAEDAEAALKNADALRCCESRSVVTVLGIHRHVIEQYDLFGTAQGRTQLVAIVTQDHAGGRLVDRLSFHHPRCLAEQRRVKTLKRLFPGLERSSTKVPATSPIDLRTWACQVAKGLAAIHKRNLLHRNLHPGAVFLDYRGHAVIDDFLFASEPREPGCKSSFGRNDYGSGPALLAPPELENGATVSSKADVWAFGCCLYAWLTGSLPSLRNHRLDLALDRLPLAYNGPLKIAIEFALQTEPQARATAEQLAEILAPERMHT